MSALIRCEIRNRGQSFLAAGIALSTYCAALDLTIG